MCACRLGREWEASRRAARAALAGGVAAAVAGLDGDAHNAAAKVADSGSHRTRKRGG